MSEVPVLRTPEVAAMLARLGFVSASVGLSGQYRHPDGCGTTVPYHSGRDISPALLRQIAKDFGVSVEEFVSVR